MTEEKAKFKGKNPKGQKKDRKKDGVRTLRSEPFQKYFSVSVFSLTLFVIFMGYLAWHLEKFEIVKTSVIDYYGLITLADQDLQRKIWVLTTDTLQISDAHSHIFEENTGKNINLSALEGNFMSLARLKPFYAQISMLNRDGKEIIRVNGNNGNPIMVSQETLQDKSDHDYFQKTRSLEKGTYYLSGLILNEEFGKVEHPLKPVIQAAAPLVDVNGARNGIVVITYDATILLSDLKKRLSQTKGVFHIVRPNGSWVIAPEGKQLWADQLGHGQTFDLEYGSVWPELLAKRSGVAVSGNTAFAFFRISLSSQISSNLPQIIPQRAGVEDALNDLIFISVVQTPALLTWILDNERAFTAGAASTLILVSLISLAVAFPLAMRQQELARRKKDQAYFQTITDTMVDGLIVIDTKGSIQSINKAGLKIFGYTEPELLNRNVTKLMKQQEAKDHKKGLNDYLSGGRAKFIGKPPREIVGRQKSGKSIDLEIAVAELRSGKQTLFIGSLRDVTEKKRAEAKAKDTEEQFRLLAEHSNDIIFLRNTKGKILYVSPSIERHLGRDPEKQVGKYAWDLLSPDDRKKVSRNWQKTVVEKKKMYKSVMRISHKNGKSFWFDSITAPIMDETGKVTAAVTASRNITDQRKAEERYKMLAEFANDIIFHRDSQGNMLYVSPSIKRHLGFEPDQIIGKTSTQMLHPDDRHLLDDWKKCVIEQGKPYRSQARLRGAKGKYIWFDSITEPIKDSSGKVTSAVTASRNISELRAAEDRSLQLGRIIEDSLNEIYVFNEKTLKFTFANRGARENLGYTSRELQKMTPVQINPKFTAKSFSKILEPLRTGEKEKIYFETQHRRKDKSLYDIEVHLQLSRVGTKPVFVAVIDDITDRKTADERLKQAQKMEAIGNLSGGIAHDFNNLLTAIQGSIQLLKSFAPDLNENAKECLDIAYQSSKRGSDLTHRLLAFSRKQSLKPEVTELNALVTNTMPLLRRTIDESIEIISHFSNKDLLVKVDTHELENSILNLAVNARDAMEDGGHLTFEISETEITKSIAGQKEIKPGHYAVLSVSDTGHGMSPEVQKKVFEPFFTTKEVGKGTGLGLSMVYGFIKQSGGHITVYSEPEQGTTIKLYLKTTQKYQKQKAKKKQPSDLNVKETGTILLVEDDKGVKKFIIRALKAKGYEVLAAEDGPSALKIMGKFLEIDLLLTDVVLPKGMDGPAIAKVFKQKFPTATVIFSSGYTGRAIKTKGFLKKGDELLSKPYDLETLLNRVRSKMKTKKISRSKKEKKVV